MAPAEPQHQLFGEHPVDLQRAGQQAEYLLYNASVTQPIFQWGAYKNQAAMGDLGEKIAERQFAEAYRMLAVSIREQYMALIGKKIALRNAQFALKLSQESLEVQQARFSPAPPRRRRWGISGCRLTTRSWPPTAPRRTSDTRGACSPPRGD